MTTEAANMDFLCVFSYVAHVKDEFPLRVAIEIIASLMHLLEFFICICQMLNISKIYSSIQQS